MLGIGIFLSNPNPLRYASLARYVPAHDVYVLLYRLLR